MTRITAEQAWDELIDLGVSEETLRVVTSINGYTLDTLEDVLFATQGYRSFEQLNGDDDDEGEDEDDDPYTFRDIDDSLKGEDEIELGIQED